MANNKTQDKYHIPFIPSLVDNLILKKIKAATGGNIRLLLNGGSPISGETQRFITNTIAPTSHLPYNHHYRNGIYTFQ